MRDWQTKIDNTAPAATGELTAAEDNARGGELTNAVKSAGITPDAWNIANDSDLTMLGQAMARYASGGIHYIDNGAANAYVLVSPSGTTGFTMPKALFQGMRARFTPRFANTGAAIANVATLGAKSILRHDRSALQAGDIARPVDMEYDPSAASGSGAWLLMPWCYDSASIIFAGIDSGTANAAVLGQDGGLSVPGGLVDGVILSYTPKATNTGAVTVNPYGLGVTAIVDWQGNPLASGVFVGGRPTMILYRAAISKFVLLPWAAASGAPSGGSLTVTGSLPALVTHSTMSPATFSATGGTAPYTWAAVGLPAGLSINASTGVVSGKPTTPGPFTATITATDSLSVTGNKIVVGTVIDMTALTWIGQTILSYTGADQSYTIPASAIALKVKQWGSDGGSGGGGGFISGVIPIEECGLVAGTDTLRAMVGGSDTGYTGVGGGTSDIAVCPYGFGGSGSGHSDSNGTQCSSGGGLSGLFKPGSAITTVDVAGANALLIAGGGGGYAYHNNSSANGQGGGQSGGAGSPQGQSYTTAAAGTAYGGGGGGRDGGTLNYVQAGNGTHSGGAGTNYADSHVLAVVSVAGGDGNGHTGAGAAANSGDPDNGGAGTHLANGRIVIWHAVLPS